MSLSITVMSLNLHEGDQGGDSPNCWEKRRDICVSVITSYSPTILCTQQGDERLYLAEIGGNGEEAVDPARASSRFFGCFLLVLADGCFSFLFFGSYDEGVKSQLEFLQQCLPGKSLVAPLILPLLHRLPAETGKL